ncbi:glycosyltransferase [Paenibacillus mesophilus]|uniref:glycosyltransferase family 2 protein n=1 Tax=Paenibacillus mesophilus TaxID=2582849 RepID=UPI00110DE562|nr:glycosyltransferase family 2 protein [Paenibacillus mesophilus]TMV53050.1 glycosyltransferase [Paenibacillus mesophilus]
MGTRKRRGARARVSLNNAYNNGYNTGYDAGHSHGYALGFQKGSDSYAAGFEGTSIVIPSLNQQAYLADCIESIGRYTPEPHEIIVVDNGSTDGTADYLRSLKNKTVRYKISERNLGFAGGVNQGLMMARGKTILFLNNDTVVTEGWLTNLLACLHGSDRFGLVGPVTNYISGDQLIKTSYGSTEEMHRFAKSFNRSDSGKWEVTGRLTGFCVLMRKDVFRRIGFLDEGFEIGNCEDDDFGFRNRLLGLDLVIAKDTFIHHVGSTTIKTLTPAQFEEMYARNLAFYSDKWGETHSLLQEVSGHWNGNPIAMNDFYPSHVTVKGTGPTVFWVEHGVRRPLEHYEGVPATRLSQIDLKNWHVGEPMSVAEWNAKQAVLAAGGSPGAQLAEGRIVQTPDGRLHQHRRGKLHRIATAWVSEVWNLNRHPVQPLTEDEAAAYPAGLPIIAPPVIKADNI